MAKTVLCRCEDVTLSDVERALDLGYRDIEEVKRYTGFGTGPCQGKECLLGVARRIAEAGGADGAAIVRPFTSRPPLAPTALRNFAGSGPWPAVRADSGLPSGDALPEPGRGAPISKRRAEIVIVGGGIMGLAIAYNLAVRGISDVVVLEAGYLAFGASGRNGGGVRQQWSTRLNIEIMRESLSLCKGFADELGVNVWLRQGGYLFLSQSERETERLAKLAGLQNEVGVPTRMVTPKEAQQIVPELHIDGFSAGCYNPTDGIIFPWPFLWGYAKGATERGVQVHTHTRVLAIEGRGPFLLRTSAGDIECDRLVNAAGAWSPEVARLLGLQLPNRPVRHEILSTESLKPFLKPLVAVLQSGLYFSQSMRGEIVGGISVHKDKDAEVQLGSTLRFTHAMAAALIALVPRFANVKVVRQWAGPYDVTSDGHPIVGTAPGMDAFYLCCGFMGHGFMMAPAVGKYYAEWLSGGKRHEMFDKYGLARFAKGEIAKEDMILG